jgi:hypothetical protein
MAGTRAKAHAKMQALRVLEATAVMQQSADKGQTAHGSDLHLFRGHVWRGKCGHDKAVKDKMSAVVRSSPPSSLHPETALLTFCTQGTLGYFHSVH